MSNADPPLALSEARAIVADIARRVRATRPEELMELFRALVLIDAEEIQARARGVLEGAESDALSDPRLSAQERLHRLSMETFQASMADYLGERYPGLDPSVEHDVPNWIEGNAAAMASAIVQRMAAQLPHTGAAGHRELIAFYRLIDPQACEETLAGMLMQAWTAIGVRIEARLAGEGAGVEP